MSYPGSPRLGSLPMSSPAAYSADSDRGSNPSHSESSSGAKISPAILITIVILAVLFFISGLLHLLVRFLSRQPSPTNSVPNRPPEVDGSDVLQRQLQHLFDLHDTGLDQTAIDALPVFHLKELVGLKDQFDCAVCLCEFSFNDKLRLLPTCGHAFHINCIDTWLQSNSTCPLCRSTLFPIDSAMFDFDDSSFPPNNVETDYSEDPMDEMNGSKGVLPVHLGKFRKVNVEVDSSVEETSNSHIDARRCYSMGSYQYILGHENLRIALGTYSNQCIKKDGEEEEVMGRNSILGSRGDSLSVSKTWLWSGKNRYKNSLDTHHEGIFPEVSWVARGAM